MGVYMRLSVYADGRNVNGFFHDTMREQMLDKELLKQWRDEGVSMSHSSPPEVANMAKRSEAPARNPGVAEMYQ
ncbi:hypothetical protein Busp01_09070 [Trinickia caryophylli]|uniref:Uncharacterized protein n=1 Tax=Trinickia caryophylli TaxID=28094 RepID=A0A1X7D0C1_TRICW|nr:hypothetical protein Busp01_09070 [Trinickia caryophylli]SMF06005.1 hypothetical protein SAMN06295900_102190 [Trinickia caryophylli]